MCLTASLTTSIYGITLIFTRIMVVFTVLVKVNASTKLGLITCMLCMDVHVPS